MYDLDWFSHCSADSTLQVWSGLLYISCLLNSTLFVHQSGFIYVPIVFFPFCSSSLFNMPEPRYCRGILQKQELCQMQILGANLSHLQRFKGWRTSAIKCLICMYRFQLCKSFIIFHITTCVFYFLLLYLIWIGDLMFTHTHGRFACK